MVEMAQTQIQLAYGRRPGYTLDESPAHRRTLTEAATQGANCTWSNCGVQYLAQAYFDMWLSVTPGELGFHQLYPLSYIRPPLCFCQMGNVFCRSCGGCQSLNRSIQIWPQDAALKETTVTDVSGSE